MENQTNNNREGYPAVLPEQAKTANAFRELSSIKPLKPPTERPYIAARNLELKTIRGYAYRDITLDIARGQVAALRGRNGSGKTALLLTLAGRMKPTGGLLQVGGFELPRERRRVTRRVGMALFSGLNDLPDSLTAFSVVGAEFDVYGKKAQREHLEAFLHEWELGDIAHVRVKDLTAEKLSELGIALAFAGNPEAVVVDNIEDQLTMSQSTELMELLIRKAQEHRVALVVGVVERDLAAMADVRVFMSKEGE